MALFAWDVGDNKIPGGRSGHVFCRIHDYIFMWGGYGDAREVELHEGHFVQSVYMDPSVVWFYYPMAKKWRRVITSYPYPDVSSGSGAVFVPSMFAVYLFFGVSGTGHKNSVYSFDLLQHKWHCITEGTSENERMPSPRDKFALWEYHNKVYIFGGYGLSLKGYLGHSDDYDVNTPSDESRGWNNQLLEFNVDIESWAVVQCSGNIPSTRAAHAATKVEDGVYVFGGRHKSRRLNDLYHLNLKSMEWTRILSNGLAPTGRSWHSMGYIRDSNRLLIVGGYSHECEVLGDVWMHDISAKTWFRYYQPSLQKKRFWHAMAVTEDSDAIIFGGCMSYFNRHAAIHLDDLTVLRFSPMSLFRLTINTIVENRGIFEYQLFVLPKHCQNLLLKLWQLSDT